MGGRWSAAPLRSRPRSRLARRLPPCPRWPRRRPGPRRGSARPPRPGRPHPPRPAAHDSKRTRQSRRRAQRAGRRRPERKKGRVLFTMNRAPSPPALKIASAPTATPVTPAAPAPVPSCRRMVETTVPSQLAPISRTTTTPSRLRATVCVNTAGAPIGRPTHEPPDPRQIAPLGRAWGGSLRWLERTRHSRAGRRPPRSTGRARLSGGRALPQCWPSAAAAARPAPAGTQPSGAAQPIRRVWEKMMGLAIIRTH
jgi:hypothetical protein